MKKILITLFLGISFGLSAQNLELPFSVKVLNPKPLDAYYYNEAGTMYTDAAEVLSEVVAGVRYEGMTFNVAGVEYWFNGGTDDGDLEIKLAGSGGGSVNFAKDGVYFDGDTVKIGGTINNIFLSIPYTDAGDFQYDTLQIEVGGEDAYGFNPDSRLSMSNGGGIVFEAFDSYNGTFTSTSSKVTTTFSSSVAGPVFSSVANNITDDINYNFVLRPDLFSISSDRDSGGDASLIHILSSSGEASLVYTDNSVATKEGITYAGDYSTPGTTNTLVQKGYVLGSKTFTGSQTFRAGTATAGTAPLYLQSGTALTTPANGALEYHSSHLYFTIGSTRYQLDQQGGGGITNGAGTNEITKTDSGGDLVSTGIFSATSEVISNASGDATLIMTDGVGGFAHSADAVFTAGLNAQIGAGDTLKMSGPVVQLEDTPIEDSGVDDLLVRDSGAGGQIKTRSAKDFDIGENFSISTAGSTITLDVNDYKQFLSKGSASFAAAKDIVLSNDDNARVITFFFEVTNVAAVITFPTDVLMADTNWDGDDWTPPFTGKFKMVWVYDGANWNVDISGQYL